MNSAQSRCLGRFGADTSGAVMVEFAIVALFFLVFTSGLVEFTLAFYQWNAATKALQLGARLAAVSDPVCTGVKELTGLDGGASPGDPMPYFQTVCDSTNPNYVAARMNTLVYGRGQTTCGGLGADGYPGMCDIFSRITPANVRVTYTQTGLGFAGRPGGPVPTITLELTGLTFNFVFLNSLLGFPPINIPAMTTTITGEDLSTAAN